MSGRQGGWSLLLALLIAFLGATFWLTGQADATRQRNAHEARNVRQLAIAKEALLAYATTFGETHPVNADPPGSATDDDANLPPGRLPCPETAGSLSPGNEAGQCGARGVTALGRLPWKTLLGGPLRDADGECLWYAVSGNFKANPAADLLNWDSAGQIEILDARGQLLASDVVAAIISPGRPVPGQVRPPGSGACGSDFGAAAYLEAATIGGNIVDNGKPESSPGGITRLVMGDAAGAVNDRLAFISRTEWLARLEQRRDFAGQLFFAGDGLGNDTVHAALAQKIAACLAHYGRHNDPDRNGIANPQDKRLPWAAPLAVADFANDSFDDASGTYAGRPPFRVGTSRGSTHSVLVQAGCSSGSDKCRLLIAEHCPTGWWRVAGEPLEANGANAYASPEGWWALWKDQFFYAVAPEFAPTSNHNWQTQPDPCVLPGNRCLNVGGQRYAAVVVFAGKAQANQRRGSGDERRQIGNYLEGINAAAFAYPGLNTGRSLAATGNDRLVCIRPDLSLNPDCS